jgi:hypothetical protein
MYFNRMFFRMIMLFHGHAEVEGRKKGENVGLDECDKKFQESHEYSEGNGYRRNGHTQGAFYISENKDQAHEAQDNDMPRADVRKETDHEDERLGENAKEFDERHQRYREFQPPGNTGGVVNMFPVIFICAEGCNNKCEQRQDPVKR